MQLIHHNFLPKMSLQHCWMCMDSTSSSHQITTWSQSRACILARVEQSGECYPQPGNKAFMTMEDTDCTIPEGMGKSQPCLLLLLSDLIFNDLYS